jgi:hypothetical protein
MTAIREREDDEYQPRDDGSGSKPIHLDAFAVSILLSVGDAQIRYRGDDSKDDCADPKEPPPGNELGRKTGEEDAGEESHGCECAVKAEDEVLARSRAVDASQ